VITANPRTGLTLTTDQQIHLLEVVTAALHSVSQDRLFFDWPALLKGLVKRTSGPIEGRQFGEFVDAVSDEVMSTVRLKDIIKGYEVMDTNEIVPDSLHEYINVSRPLYRAFFWLRFVLHSRPCTSILYKMNRESAHDTGYSPLQEDEVVCRRNITGAIVTTTLLVQEAEHVGTDQPAST
jgi:hypothetical protein